ncbi:threonine/serine exporter family protein [Companilactobacillus baiquanensis]|uniref:Threonine/serine exporter family protein n=1 Tax=Companilactobacillus baiquanensis TaxID=2486005 RepID=A0ABW1UV95_9LACO|nr:threonine/serine exporter family protein [Companilactobacillus baiquanensis]
MSYFLKLIIQVVLSYIGTAGFGLIINIPKRALNLAGWSGAIGWLTYWVLFEAGSGRMFSNLVAGISVGICGIIFSHVKRMPVILFNIPGLVPLVPGATAYQAVSSLVLGNFDQAIALGVKVSMVAGSIATGFMIAQIIGEWYYKTQLKL